MASKLQGQFLVAAGHLRDPNFFRTVVLIIEHDQDAMGLVINRPLSISVDAAISSAPPTSPNQDPVYSGGPVETTALFILHNSAQLATTDSAVADGIYLTGSNESLDALISKPPVNDQNCHFRVYSGYAGWGPGQLESELDRGDWLIMPADHVLVFEEDPYRVWEVCTQQICEQHRLLPHNVRNPEWN